MGTESQRWKRLQELFEKCLGLTQVERRRFLEEGCGGDSERG